jgi:hypothetical protein
MTGTAFAAAQRSAVAGASLDAASALVGESGYPVDSALLQGQAQRHRMAALLANHGGPTGCWTSAGRGAFQDEQGRSIAALPGPGDGPLVVRTSGGAWAA